MVTAAPVRSIVAALLLAALGLSMPRPAHADAANTAPSPTTDPAASGLKRGNYPWYDAPTDSIKPVPAPREYEPPDWAWLKWPIWSWIGAHLPDASTIALVLAVFLLIALLCALAWSIIRRLPGDLLVRADKTDASRSVARVGPLPAGLDPGTTDPWAEALRLRASGDYAGAIVRLFAHQLLSLDRLGLARLAPGRTGRQLVRSVSVAAARDRVEPTLRLFEDVYYGHRPPSPRAFEAAWTRAEELEDLIARGALS